MLLTAETASLLGACPRCQLLLHAADQSLYLPLKRMKKGENKHISSCPEPHTNLSANFANSMAGKDPLPLPFSVHWQPLVPDNEDHPT